MDMLPAGVAIPRLGSISLASNSSLGDWRVVKATYTIKIRTLKDDPQGLQADGKNGTLEVRPDAPRPSRSPTDRAVVSEFDVRSNGDQRIPLKYIGELNYFFV